MMIMMINRNFSEKQISNILLYHYIDLSLSLSLNNVDVFVVASKNRKHKKGIIYRYLEHIYEFIFD